MLASGDASTSRGCPEGATYPQRRLRKSEDRYRARNENFVRVWVAQDDRYSTVRRGRDIKGNALG